MTRALLLLTTVVLVAGCATSTAPRAVGSRTSIVWRALSLDAAQAAAVGEGRKVLVVFTASFSPAARALETETLADGRVSSLVANATVPIRVDVVKARELTQRLHVRVAPTVILLEGSGEEIERWTGEQKIETFAVALQAALGGSSSIAQARAGATSRSPRERFLLGQTLAGQGRYEAALTEHLSLLRDAFAGESSGAWSVGSGRRHNVNFGEIIGAIGRFHTSHPSAREALRDVERTERASMLAHPEQTARAWRFGVASRVLGDEDGFLDAFRALIPGEARDALAKEAFQLLVARRACVEAAAVFPVERVVAHIKSNSDAPLAARGAIIMILPPLAGFGIHQMRESLLQKNTRYFEAFAGAGRDDEAGVIARAIVRGRNTRSAFEALCIAARRVRPDDHAAFIDELGIPELSAEEKRRR